MASTNRADNDELPRKRTRNRLYCNHCSENVSKSTYYRHKNMLFDVDIPSDSDSSSDTTSKYQQLQEEQEMKDIILLLCSRGRPLHYMYPNRNMST